MNERRRNRDVRIKRRFQFRRRRPIPRREVLAISRGVLTHRVSQPFISRFHSDGDLAAGDTRRHTVRHAGLEVVTAGRERVRACPGIGMPGRECTGRDSALVNRCERSTGSRWAAHRVQLPAGTARHAPKRSTGDFVTYRTPSACYRSTECTNVDPSPVLRFRNNIVTVDLTTELEIFISPYNGSNTLCTTMYNIFSWFRSSSNA